MKTLAVLSIDLGLFRSKMPKGSEKENKIKS
jgi:hypothetical protein